MDQSEVNPPSPPDERVPLQDYKPIRSDSRKAGEHDAVLGAAGPGDDVWAWVKVLLAIVAFIVAAVILDQT